MTYQPTPPDRTRIERLAGAEQDLALTGITPLSHDGPKNQVRIKNQIHALSRAIEARLGRAAADDLRTRLDQTAQPVRGLQRPASWCVMTDGASIESLLLPERFPERLVEGRRYYVRPLIQSAVARHDFLVLALSQGDVRLYRMCGEQMTGVELDTLPGSLADVVGHEVEEQALQHHTAGNAIFHAQAKGQDDRGPELERFVQAVDRAIGDDEALRHRPLVLAAVEKVDALFRRLTQHRHLLPAGVRLSPDQTSAEDLRLAARNTFEDWRLTQTRRLVASLEEDLRRTTSSVDDIVRAAIEGRVDTLIVAGDDALWGRFDTETRVIELHDQRTDVSEDLIDTAMRAAWQQSGQVHRVEPELLGSAAPMLARMRF